MHNANWVIASTRTYNFEVEWKKLLYAQNADLAYSLNVRKLIR